MIRDAVMIACQVVAEEMKSQSPLRLPIRVLDPALHSRPDRLRSELQQVIDEEERRCGTILLGYGLCSRAIEGLRSERARLVVPKVDDCIGLFLGSRKAHVRQNRIEPGTFYLSKGWIETGVTPFGEFEYMRERFGPERAERLMGVMLKHYTRLAFIDTSRNGAASSDRCYAKEAAARYGLRYEEISGDMSLLTGMAQGACDDRFLVLRPGREISYEMFLGDFD